MERFTISCKADSSEKLVAYISEMTPGTLALCRGAGDSCSWRVGGDDLRHLREMIDEILGVAEKVVIKSPTDRWWKAPGAGVTDDRRWAHVYTRAEAEAISKRDDVTIVPVEPEPAKATTLGIDDTGFMDKKALAKAADLIDSGLTWRKTAEGRDFWWAIRHRLDLTNYEPMTVSSVLGTDRAGVLDAAKVREAASLLFTGMRFSSTTEGWVFWYGLYNRLLQLVEGAVTSGVVTSEDPKFAIGAKCLLKDGKETLESFSVSEPAGTPCEVIRREDTDSYFVQTATGRWYVYPDMLELEPSAVRLTVGTKIRLKNGEGTLDSICIFDPPGTTGEIVDVLDTGYRVETSTTDHRWAVYFDQVEAWRPVVGERVTIGPNPYTKAKTGVLVKDVKDSAPYLVHVTEDSRDWWLCADRVSPLLVEPVRRPRVGDRVEIVGKDIFGQDNRGWFGMLTIEEDTAYPFRVAHENGQPASWYAAASVKVI